LALFKVLLTGSAAVWLDAQTPAILGNFTQLKEAYSKRYKTPELLKYKSAREIFSRRQRDDESVEDFISYMKKLSRNIGADDKMTGFAILNGLRPAIAAYVTQQKAENVEEMLAAARIAEMTSPPASSDTALAERLADVQVEVKRLSQKWDRLTAAPVERLPSPRRVSFADRRDRTPPPQRPATTGDQGYRGQPFSRSRGNYFRGRSNVQNFRSNTNAMCPKCGRQAHTNMLYCPANNRLCNTCNKRGHFAVACRSAIRARGRGINRFN